MKVLRFPRLAAAWVGLCAALLLSACASAPSAVQPPPQLFQDQLFRPGTQRIDAAEVFALSPAMQQYLDQEIARQLRQKGPRDGLLSALYDKSQLQLDYDSQHTRNAAEAFADRRGNCLSLVIMTGAMARHLGLSVRYQSVFVDEFWARHGDLYFLTGHINMTLGRGTSTANTVVSSDGDLLTIDFLPGAEIRKQRSRVVEEHTVVALYMNNRAAELLAAGAVDEAYWWVRAAILADPKLLQAYNTLGVIYRRHGNLAQAENALRHVLSQEPQNTQGMANMVLVMRDQGRTGEADTLSAQLKELQPFPPYRFFDLGMAAMREGRFKDAKQLFDREIARSAYFHEFHFWAAMASYGQGDMADTRKHLRLAMENSTTVKDRQAYTAKLELLRGRSSVQQ